MAITFTPTNTKNMAYDHPAYIARQVFAASTVTGSAGTSTKYVAYANMALFSVNVYTNVTGTTTLTNTVGTAGTATVSSAIFSFIRVTNTASAGSSVSLSTTTVGPFYIGGIFASGGTGTAQVGGFNSYAISTNTATTQVNPYGLGVNGGLAVNQGDLFWVVNGTDATANYTVEIDYQLQPLASIVS